MKIASCKGPESKRWAVEAEAICSLPLQRTHSQWQLSMRERALFLGQLPQQASVP